MRLRAFGATHLAALALVFAAPARSHELGIVQVQATFDGKGGVTVDLLIDGPHLPPIESLGPLPATPRAIEGLSTVSDERVRAFVPLFLSRTTIAFDGLPKDLAASVLAAPDAAAATALPGFHPVVVRLAGTVPPGARDFTFRNGLKLGYFVLTLRAPFREPERQWLEGDQPSAPFALTGLAPPKLSRAKTLGLYLGLGFTHILPKGFDHVLFVLGLFLLSLRIRPLLLQITAFTIAHTLTLGLTIAGVVSLPSTLVEPLIALSIAYVGIENVTTSELKPWRPALVFCFGLIHGMGFAGVLAEIGLPKGELVPALLAFNVGVEGGQLAVIALAFLFLGIPMGRQAWYRKRVVVPLSLTISAAGLYWAFERILS